MANRTKPTEIGVELSFRIDNVKGVLNLACDALRDADGLPYSILGAIELAAEELERISLSCSGADQRNPPKVMLVPSKEVANG